jgi:membrane protease YdiL (CAAX protease family)
MTQPRPAEPSRSRPGDVHRSTGHPARDWGLIVLGMTLPTVITWLYFIALSQRPAGQQQAAYAIGKGVQFALPVIWWLGSKPRERFSLRVNLGVPVSLVLGTLIVLTMAALYWGVLVPAGVLEGPRLAVQQKVTGLGIRSPAWYATLGVFYALVHSGLEEYYWRWFVFGALRRRVAISRAVLFSGLAFMAHHVLLLAMYFGWQSPWTWFFAASIAIGGMIWAVIYQRWQSLLGPWLSHLMVDAAIFLIGYQLVAEVWRT